MPAHDAPDDVAQQIADLIVRVHEIHDGIIRQTGGLEGLRDGGMLHAAVARPFATFAGMDLYEDDFEKAAALFHSLIKSHPFIVLPRDICVDRENLPYHEDTKTQSL